MKIRPGEFPSANRGLQAAGPLDLPRQSSSAATPDLSRHSGLAAKAERIRARSARAASAESDAPGCRRDGVNPPDLLGRRHDPPAFPRRKVGPPSWGLGPARVSLSKRGPAASLRLSAGQRPSSLGWLHTRSRAIAPTPNVTVIHASGCKTQGTLSAAFAATATQAKPQRFFTRLISGESRIWPWPAAARLSHAVAARRG
jgi:hypothetical protein